MRSAAALLVLLTAACDGVATRDASVPAADARTAAIDPPPPTRGLDSLLLQQAFDSAANLPRLHSLLVARHGELVREEYFGGRGPDRRANIKSASKSIVSALVGIAIEEGHLQGLDQPIAPFFPSVIGDDADPRLHRITIGNLLSMQAGLEPTSGRNYGAWVTSDNWVRHALTRSFDDDPGGRMQYSTGSSHLLSAILTQATGMSTLEYARTRLANPLDIELSAWARDPQGIYFGGNDMYLRPRDMLTFGELYRNGGTHEGTQVVPEGWVRESWVPRTRSRYNRNRYGLGWWMRGARGYDIYFAWGYGGQYVFIVPELELTVVTTSDAAAPREGGHNRALHNLLDDLLIPAAVQGSDHAVAGDRS
ncbi:MAG TPA: serine hydrolase [Longimicrobiales bacterium]|nr:serine hydrolase [Longimicrobiales bacterium]